MHEKLTNFVKDLHDEEQKRIYYELISKYPQLKDDFDEEDFLNASKVSEAI